MRSMPAETALQKRNVRRVAPLEAANCECAQRVPQGAARCAAGRARLGILVITLAACASAPVRTTSDVPAATLQDYLQCGVWEGNGRSSYGPYAIKVIVTRSGPWTHALSIIRPEGVNREIRASYSIGGAKGGPGELLLLDDLGVTRFSARWVRQSPAPEIAFTAANEASRRDVRLEWLPDGRRRSSMKVKLARPIPGILTESEFEQIIALTKPSSCEVQP